MVDGGLGISAAVAIGSKFIEPSKFSSRHDGSYDKEVEKSLYAADRFEKIPKEDVDYFEAEVYNALHSKSLMDLRTYRSVQDEYKEKKWYKEPTVKFRHRSEVRLAKRRAQHSISQERDHVDELETYSRSISSRSSSASMLASDDGWSSGLDLDRSREYRTDSLSVRATGHSPPSASLEDIRNDELKDIVHDHVSGWLASVTTEAQQFATPGQSHSVADDSADVFDAYSLKGRHSVPLDSDEEESGDEDQNGYDFYIVEREAIKADAQMEMNGRLSPVGPPEHNSLEALQPPLLETTINGAQASESASDPLSSHSESFYNYPRSPYAPTNYSLPFDLEMDFQRIHVDNAADYGVSASPQTTVDPNLFGALPPTTPRSPPVAFPFEHRSSFSDYGGVRPARTNGTAPTDHHPHTNYGNPTQATVSPSHVNSQLPVAPSIPHARSLREVDDEAKDDTRKKYRCPACPRVFARTYNLKTHMATHDPNHLKPHVCPHVSCGRSFSRKHDLGRHLVSIHRNDSVTSFQHSGSARQSTVAVEKGPRGWCNPCGRGWVGREKACECND